MELSEKYISQFRRTLEDFNSNLIKTNPDEKYALFFPMIGNNYKKKREILLIGRATNNWYSFKFGRSNYKKIEERSNNYSHETGDKCPMSWLITPKWKYVVGNSKFWQAIRDVVNEINDSDDEKWYSSLAWSNLYKIAKARVGNANPDSLEIKAQEDNCKRLFKMEIDELKPKRVIIFSHYEYYTCHAKPFLDSLGSDLSGKKLNSDYVQFSGYYKQSKIIVAGRPDSRKKGLTLEKFTKKIIEAL